MKTYPFSFTRLAIGLVPALLSACKTVLPPVVEVKRATPVLYDWKGAELTGPVAIRIDLSEQKAELTRGGQPAGWTYVASGVSAHRTPAGSFSISEKVQDKHSTSWGQIIDGAGGVLVSDAKNGRDSAAGGQFAGAPMPFWMRINGPIGMHAGPIPDPGQPASHGCIRLPREMAEILFGVTEIGTPVQVVP